MTALRWHGRLVLRVEGCSLGNDPRRGAALVAFMDTLHSEIGEVEVVLRGVSRGTVAPQHSVTEHEAFKAAMVAKHYVGSMFDYFLAEGEITYHDPVANQMYDAWQAGRAQPLASTAATQPEQASIRRWEDRASEKYPAIPMNKLAPWAKLVEAKAEIRDLRAALAIPASPAVSEQQANVVELPPLPRAMHSYQASSDSEFAANWKAAYTADQMHDYARAALSGRATTPNEHEGTVNMKEVLTLLRMRTPQADGRNIHIVLKKPRYPQDGSIEDVNNHDRFLYNKNTCPSNFLGVVEMVDGDETDPVGLFQHVQTIEVLGEEIDLDNLVASQIVELFSKFEPFAPDTATTAADPQGAAQEQAGDSVLAPIINAVEMHDATCLNSTIRDDAIIWTATSVMGEQLHVTLGDFRRIALAICAARAPFPNPCTYCGGSNGR